VVRAVAPDVAILGAGSWGIALAIHLARAGARVRLCPRRPEIARHMRRHRRHPDYLSDLELPSAVDADPDATAAARQAALVIVAVPSEFFGAALAGLGRPGGAVVSATKGFDPVRHVRMTELVTECLPGTAVAALSGPTFAREVALGRPTAAVIAARDEGLAVELQRKLGTREFRLYTNRDVVGVEVGGAVKNVVALATGIADGLGLGENARAGLITRGLAEMTRLAVALGAEPATLFGLAGLGDLVLTATGTQSRNRALGLRLGRGERDRPEAAAAPQMIAEGVPTVRAALALARRHGVSLPICTEVSAVLFEGKAPADAMTALLERRARPEDAPVGGGSA